MELRLEEIATLVGGTLHGDGSLSCKGANPAGQSTAEEITLVLSPADPAIWNSENKPALAFVTDSHQAEITLPQIVCEEPHQAFEKIVAHFRPPLGPKIPGVGCSPFSQVAATAEIHPTATIAEDVVIGERTKIMPGVVIMAACSIGDDCVIYPNVTLYERTEIADRVVIHASSVLGAHGFGYRQEGGRHVAKAQLGTVKVENDVEIGASVTIDRGSYGATTIREATKIDNQVMIAHNCQIGKHNLLCSQVGVAGSCKTGDYVTLAGQVGLKDHITLGDHTIIGAKAGVMDDCPGNQFYLGAPAIPYRDQMQIFALQRKLPEMRKELKELRKQLQKLAPSSDQPESTKKTGSKKSNRGKAA